MEKYKIRIIDILRKTSRPLDIENIRIKANIGNWNTALKHCLELLIDRRIRGVKTSKSWIFWIEKDSRDAEGEMKIR